MAGSRGGGGSWPDPLVLRKLPARPEFGAQVGSRSRLCGPGSILCVLSVQHLLGGGGRRPQGSVNNSAHFWVLAGSGGRK